MEMNQKLFDECTQQFKVEQVSHKIEDVSFIAYKANYNNPIGPCRRKSARG